AVAGSATSISLLYPCVCACECSVYCCFFFSSRRRHTRCLSDWSSDVCSSDLADVAEGRLPRPRGLAGGPQRHPRADPRARGGRQIGRASCRERVWTEVVTVAAREEMGVDRRSMGDVACVMRVCTYVCISSHVC